VQSAVISCTLFSTFYKNMARNLRALEKKISRSVIAPNSLVFSCFLNSGWGSAGTLLPPLEDRFTRCVTVEELLWLRLQLRSLALIFLTTTKIPKFKL
jgi:hypothetical protein